MGGGSEESGNESGNDDYVDEPMSEAEVESVCGGAEQSDSDAEAGSQEDEDEVLKKKLKKTHVPLRPVDATQLKKMTQHNNKIGNFTAFMMHTKQPGPNDENKKPRLMIDAGSVILDSATVLKSNLATQILFTHSRDLMSNLFMSGETAVKARPGANEMLFSYRDWFVELFICSKEPRAWAMHDALTRGMLLKKQAVKYVPELETLVDSKDLQHTVIMTTPERADLFKRIKCNVVTVAPYKFFPVHTAPTDEDKHNHVINHAHVKQAAWDAVTKSVSKVTLVELPPLKRVSIFQTETQNKRFKDLLARYQDQDTAAETAAAPAQEKYMRPIRRTNSANLKIKIPKPAAEVEIETPYQRMIRINTEKFYLLQSGMCCICRQPLSPVGGITYRCMSSGCSEHEAGSVIELNEYVESFEFTKDGVPTTRTSLLPGKQEEEDWHHMREPVRQFLNNKKGIYDDENVDYWAKKVFLNANQVDSVATTIERTFASIQNTQKRAVARKTNVKSVQFHDKVCAAAWALGDCMVKNPALKETLYELANREGALHHPGFVEGAVYQLTTKKKKMLSPDGKAFINCFSLISM